jgi:hypothetical protein
MDNALNLYKMVCLPGDIARITQVDFLIQAPLYHWEIRNIQEQSVII